MPPLKKLEILQKEIEIKNSKIRSLEKALTEIETFGKDLRENNQILQESIDTLKSENLYYEKLLDRKNLAFEDLKGKVQILEGFVLESQGKRDDLGRANGELLGRVVEGEAKRDAAERGFADAQIDIRDLEDRLFELHQKFGAAERGLASKEGELRLGRERTSDLEDEVRFIEGERQKLLKNSKTNLFLIGSLVFIFAVATGAVSMNGQNGCIYDSSVTKPGNSLK